MFGKRHDKGEWAAFVFLSHYLVFFLFRMKDDLIEGLSIKLQFNQGNFTRYRSGDIWEVFAILEFLVKIGLVRRRLSLFRCDVDQSFEVHANESEVLSIF